MMNETVLPPSPNWFQVSGLAVTTDGWLVYGGPNKSLCFLEPVPVHNGVIHGSKYRAHVFNKVNYERITSVDVSPEWPTKRFVLTGSVDGAARQWSLEKLKESNKIKPELSHEVHSSEKEDVVGVGYSTQRYAVTVGTFGNIVKWDLNANIVKTYFNVKSFRPLCMACSPHIRLHVAIGTKQGVVFVLDLNDNQGRIVYKVRGQDDEITSVSWCPKLDVTLKKTFELSKKSKILKDQKENLKEVLDQSGSEKNLPEDSFDVSSGDEVEVPDDDIFDIYADHEDDEFGHKKYKPEEITVKVQTESKQDEYLAECLKVKEEILKRKAQTESSMQALVDALEDTHVDSKENDGSASNSKGPSSVTSDICDKQSLEAASVHIHKHLLATIDKNGGVRIWSKNGKSVSSCVVSGMQKQKTKTFYWANLLWCRPDKLFIADGKHQLLECNPLKINKNKLSCSLSHTVHKRTLYCIASNAPKVQTETESVDDYDVFTVSQDRYIAQYSIQKQEVSAVHGTSGGFIYMVVPCPYDASKIAVSVSDGGVRVWETHTLEDNDNKLALGHVTTFWQNVQGKVLVVAWHPTKENVLAFATAESRVGILDTSKSDKPAKLLIPVVGGGIYSLCWGEGSDLYACGNGQVVVYNTRRNEDPPIPVVVEAAERQWKMSVVRWHPAGLTCGSLEGGVAILSHQRPHSVYAASIVFSKMIHAVEWHPQQTSNSSEESPYKNYLATCSADRQGSIIILEYVDKEDGGKQLQTVKTLSGHQLVAYQLAWNPHQDMLLVSTAQDNTARVWDCIAGVCLSVFTGHNAPTLTAAWLPYPQLATKLVSGGGDSCLHLWDFNDWPASDYSDDKLTIAKRERRNYKKGKLQKAEEQKAIAVAPATEELTAVRTSVSRPLKGPKRLLIPLFHRSNIKECLIHACKILFKKYLEKRSLDSELEKKLTSEINSKEQKFTAIKKGTESNSCKQEDSSIDQVNEAVAGESHYNFDYLKIFGSIKEINELLDRQMEDHRRVSPEAFITLGIFRGHIDAVVQFASQKDMLCPFLLSMTPCVSYKYWKDATQLYLAQMDRLQAKDEMKRYDEPLSYGGPVYRKVATQLSVHDVRGAVDTLVEARLHKEAYILCRTRYMESIAEEVLKHWVREHVRTGLYVDAAICYIVLGNLIEAATMLSQVRVEESLELARDIAQIAGHKLLVDHITEKHENIKNTPETSEKTDEILEKLPSRFELLMKDGNKPDAVNDGASSKVNGNHSKE